MIGLQFEKIFSHLWKNTAMPDHNTTKVHLEKTKTQENEEQALMAVSQSSYSGPIPPASELEKYNTILP